MAIPIRYQSYFFFHLKNLFLYFNCSHSLSLPLLVLIKANVWVCFCLCVCVCVCVSICVEIYLQCKPTVMFIISNYLNHCMFIFASGLQTNMIDYKSINPLNQLAKPLYEYLFFDICDLYLLRLLLITIIAIDFRTIVAFTFTLSRYSSSSFPSTLLYYSIIKHLLLT